MKRTSLILSILLLFAGGVWGESVNGFEVEIEQFGACFGTEDFKEGTTAFLEKRKADFPGK